MPKRKPNTLTKRETQALILLWDKGHGTPYSLQTDKRILDNLVGYGFVERRRKFARSFVGNKASTIYLLTERGRQECLLTGKRFVPTLAT